MTRLHAEVVRTINFYRSQQGGSQPAMVLLAGGCSMIPHVNVFLKEKLKIDVDFINPFRNVAVSSGIPAEKVADDLNLLGEVVGLALRRVLSCPVEINLLPPALAARKVLQRRIPFFGLAAFGMVLTILVFGLFLHQMKSMAEQRLKMVQARVAMLSVPNVKLGELIKQEEQVYAKAADLNRLIEARTQWVAILSDLHERLLPGMWLTAVMATPARDKTSPARIEIRGMAFSDEVNNQAVTEYVARLKGTGYFTEDLQIRRIRPVDGTDYAMEFMVDVVLKETRPGKKAGAGDVPPVKSEKVRKGNA